MIKIKYIFLFNYKKKPFLKYIEEFFFNRNFIFDNIFQKHFQKTISWGMNSPKIIFLII